MTPVLSSLGVFRQSVERELCSNILPFWARWGFNESTGGLAGIVTCDLRVYPEIPQHAVLATRILWTFSQAVRVRPDPRWLEAGQKAHLLLKTRFLDPDHGGIYWSLRPDGDPLSDRKQVYAQAFAIYGLSAWYRATGDREALDGARELFRLLEAHARDREHGGYVEALSRSWGHLEDMRLSDKDLNAPKSYNTMLHMLEAYTALLQVWPTPAVREALHDLLRICLDRIYREQPFPHCGLFFGGQWQGLSTKISYGHDIEASWLFWEAAVALGDEPLQAQTRTIALALADAVLTHGVDEDGAILYDGEASGPENTDKHWWPQAEAVVGFLNAWQLAGRPEHLEAALRAWAFIESKLIDSVNGEWFALLDRSGQVLPDYPEHPESLKIGPWKCPYHNARACLEAMRRVDDLQP